MNQKSITSNGGVWYIIGGMLGVGFLIGAYCAEKFPMKYLWNPESIGSTFLFSFFILFGVYKVWKRKLISKKQTENNLQ